MIMNTEIKKENKAEWQMSPLGNYVMIMPYDESPFLTQEEDGLILGNDNKFINDKTGQEENKQLWMGVAKVVEIGPDCKYLKRGMDVFFPKTAVRSLPIGKNDLFIVSESNVVFAAGNHLSADPAFTHLNNPEYGEL